MILFPAALPPIRRWALLLAGLACLIRPSVAQEKIKVAAIYTVPVEQQWVSCVHRALNAAKDRGEIDYQFSENVSNADYERSVRQYAESGRQLIVGEAFAVESALRRVAREYPGVAFLMGSSGRPQPPNLAVFDDYIQESSYLSGMIAGSLTRSGRIGMVGGYAIPEVNRLMNAFMAGVRQASPKAVFTVTFIGSWFDPPKAKEAAFAQMDRGVDVLYAERFGVSDAAKERGMLAIGNVIDTQAQYPSTVVVSALWRMEPTIDRALAAVRSGSFKAEDYGKYSMMAYHGNDLSDLGTFAGKVPQAVLSQVAAKKADILAGRFQVPLDDTEPKSER